MCTLLIHRQIGVCSLHLFLKVRAPFPAATTQEWITPGQVPAFDDITDSRISPRGGSASGRSEIDPTTVRTRIDPLRFRVWFTIGTEYESTFQTLDVFTDHRAMRQGISSRIATCPVDLTVT